MELPDSFRIPAGAVMRNYFFFPLNIFFGEIPPSCPKCQEWTKTFFMKLFITFSKTIILICEMYLVCYLCRSSVIGILLILLHLCGFQDIHCQHFFTYLEHFYVFVGFVTKLLMLACFLLCTWSVRISKWMSVNVYNKQELIRKNINFDA